jgi:hypothetical protein
MCSLRRETFPLARSCKETAATPAELRVFRSAVLHMSERPRIKWPKPTKRTAYRIPPGLLDRKKTTRVARMLRQI